MMSSFKKADSLGDLVDNLAKMLAKYGWEELKDSLQTLLLPVSKRQVLLNNILLVKVSAFGDI